MRRLFNNCQAGLIAALLMLLPLRTGTAQMPGPEPQPPKSQHTNENERAARALLQDGKLENALRRALLAYKADPGKPSAQTLLGDIYYRMADFDRAESLYRSAADSDPTSACAWLGLGRIDLLRFNRRSARVKLARAYELDPTDPQIIRSYAANAENVGAEVALLRKYLALRVGKRRDLESALGHVILHEKTDNKKLGTLASAYRSYEIPLYASREETFLLQVSVNGGSPLHLVLDTGVRGIVIDATAARNLGLRYLVQSSLDGLGNSGPTSAQTALADTVCIGDLVYRDCAIDVSGRPLSEHADGVIGSVLFQQFLVTLDLQRKIVSLVPFTEGSPRLSGEGEKDWADCDRRIPAGMEHFIRVSQIENIILVPTQIKGAGSGYFILDTGASSSSVSKAFAPDVNLSFLGASLMFHGAGGNIGNVYRAYPFALRFGNLSFVDPNLIALDLRGVSNREGVEVAGIIGSPMLAHSRISIDYRDGLLSVEDDR